MTKSARTFALAQFAVRHFSKTAPKQSEITTPRFKQLKEAQKRFGIEDNVPVHLKGGVFDRILYQATAAGTVVGVGLSLYSFYEMAIK